MKIKVRKKKDVKSANKMPFAAPEKRRRDERRELISTVSGWVDEFQRTRREESKETFGWPAPAPVSSSSAS